MSNFDHYRTPCCYWMHSKSRFWALNMKPIMSPKRQVVIIKTFQRKLPFCFNWPTKKRELSCSSVPFFCRWASGVLLLIHWKEAVSSNHLPLMNHHQHHHQTSASLKKPLYDPSYLSSNAHNAATQLCLWRD